MVKPKSKARKKSRTDKSKGENKPAPDTGQTLKENSGGAAANVDSSDNNTSKETPRVTRRIVSKEAQKSVAAQLEEHTSKTKSDSQNNLQKEETTKPKSKTSQEEGMQLRRSQRKIVNRVIPGVAVNLPEENVAENVVPSPSSKKIQPQPRRLPGGHYIELMMECNDDELSSYQIEAHKKANEEYLKAKKLIDAAKAGQLVINGSQTKQVHLGTTVQATNSANDEDLIIVGETPAKRLPQMQPKIQIPPQPQVVQNPQIQQQVVPNPQIPQPMSAPRQQIVQRQPFPPPQLRGGHQTVTRQTLANAPTRSQLATRLVNPPVQISTQSPVSGVFPQQVYKFVNVQNPSQPLGGQWTIRPLVKVVPQQAQQDNNQQIIQFQKVQKSQQHPVKSPDKEESSQLKVAGSLFGVKKVSDPSDLGLLKKKQVKKTELDVSPDKWVPLDEYYYGKLEGDRSYSEEKGEYRFKCWYCMKMLYNNVRTMMHVQGHIDSEKQQNIDLSDLTQCKHCYKQFDTPFEMQTHVEKVHLNASNVLMCRICEKDLNNRNALTSHMRNLHNACEMPYICPLCSFRSSMYIDVVDHFKKKHDSSQHLLCLYCLKIFNVKFVMNGWAQTKNYYHHLLKHQSKSTSKKCPLCKLTFINVHDMFAHKKKDHQSNIQKSMASKYDEPEESDQVLIRVPQAGMKPSKESKMQELKSLNAPAVSKVKDYYGIKMADEIKGKICYECTMPMNAADHYKKHVECVMCRFATSCSYAYASHMMGFHSGQMTSLNLNIPWERPMAKAMYCLCGFGSKYGNKIATHLVYCTKRTCYSTVPDVPQSSAGKQGPESRQNTGANLLGVLGLVKKQNIIHSDRSSSDRDLGTSKDEDSGSGTLRGKRTRTAPAEIHSMKKFKPAVPAEVTRRSRVPGKKTTEGTVDNENESDVVIIDDSDTSDVTKTSANTICDLYPAKTVMQTDNDKKSISDEKEMKDSALLKGGVKCSADQRAGDMDDSSESSKTKTDKRSSDDISKASSVDKDRETVEKSSPSPDAKGDASKKYEISLHSPSEEDISVKTSKEMEVESNVQSSTDKKSHANESEGVGKSTVQSTANENETSAMEVGKNEKVTTEENTDDTMEVENSVDSIQNENETVSIVVDNVLSDADSNMEVESTPSINKAEESQDEKETALVSNTDSIMSDEKQNMVAQQSKDADCDDVSSGTPFEDSDHATTDEKSESVSKSDDTILSSDVKTDSPSNAEEDVCVSSKLTVKSSDEYKENVGEGRDVLDNSALNESKTLKNEDFDSEPSHHAAGHRDMLEETFESTSASPAESDKECLDNKSVRNDSDEKIESDKVREINMDDGNTIIQSEPVTPEIVDPNSDCKQEIKTVASEISGDNSTLCAAELSERKNEETDSIITTAVVNESSDECRTESAMGKASSVFTSIRDKDSNTEKTHDHCALSDSENAKLDKHMKSSDRLSVQSENTADKDILKPGHSPEKVNTSPASQKLSINKEQIPSEGSQSHDSTSDSKLKDDLSNEQRPSPVNKRTERTQEKTWERQEHSRSEDRSRERYDRDRSDDRSRDRDRERDRGTYSRDNRDYRSGYSSNDYRSHHGGNSYGGGYHRDGNYRQDNRDSGRYGRNDNYYGNRQRQDRYDHHSDRYDRSRNDQRHDNYGQQKSGYRSGYR